MSKIDEMLKNEKVEWKKLGEVAEIESVSPKKKIKRKEYLHKGLFPIIDQGQDFIVGFTNDSDAIFEKDKYVIFGDHTESVKYVDFEFAQGADGIKVLKTDKRKLDAKYLYYCILKFYETQGKYMRHYSKLKETVIPIISLKAQEKIVNYLDEFTNYAEKIKQELQKELDLRNKEYEFYRDKLLSEEYLNKLCNEIKTSNDLKKLSYEKLKDLADIVVGGDVPKSNFSKVKTEKYNVPIFSNGTDENSLYGYTSEAKVFQESITVSARGTIGYVSIKKEPYYPIVRLLCLIPKNENLNLSYLYYFLQQYKFNYVQTGIPSLTSDMIKNIKVPLPNIYIQEKIVEILDKFQALTQDVSGLLPDEIEKRQKQYEYYREKLLTFDTESTRGGVPPIK